MHRHKSAYLNISLVIMTTKRQRKHIFNNTDIKVFVSEAEKAEKEGDPNQAEEISNVYFV